MNPRSAGRAMLLLIGVCAGIALLLVASGVAVWAWVIGPALGQHPTSDGSMCSWFSGECAALSQKELASYTGVVLPTGSKILASHSSAGMKESDAFGLVCTGDADALLSQARAKGYIAGSPSTMATSEPTIALGSVQAVLIRNAQLSESEQIFVGGSCGSHKARVLLTHHWNG